MTFTDHFAFLDEYLSVCEVALAATPAGVPLRSYVSPGIPSWDCEQLVVYSNGMGEADTLAPGGPLAEGHRVTVTGDVPLLTMTAVVLRCVPVVDENGNMPSAASMSAAAAVTCADFWAIWNTVKSRKRDETLFAPKSRELFMDHGVPLSAEGGLAGWSIQIRVAIGGYDVPA